MAQVIAISVSPILTRIYSPDDFGVLALYFAIVSLLSIIATGRYEYAIVIPKNEKDAFNILLFALLLATFISSVLFVIFLLFNHEITLFLGNPAISNWLYLVPFSVFLTSIYQIFNYYNSRKKHYKNLAKSQITRSATTASVNLLMGFEGFLHSGLIVGNLIGQLLGSIVLGKMTYTSAKPFFKDRNRLKIFLLSKKHKKLPLYNLPNAIMDDFKLLFVTILIGKLFSVAILGEFSLAWKMLQVPMSLIGSSLSQVLYVELAQVEVKELNKVAKNFLLKTSLIISPIFIFIYFFSEDIFSFVFGEKWLMSGTIASILSPWMFFSFLTSPLASIFIIINKQEVLFIYSIIILLVLVGTLLLFWNDGILVMMQYISISMSSILVMFIGVLFYNINVANEKNLQKN